MDIIIIISTVTGEVDDLVVTTGICDTTWDIDELDFSLGLTGLDSVGQIRTDIDAL